MIPLIFAIAVLVLVAAAEWLHTRRIRVASRLAFGPSGARPWTRFVPLLRSLSLAAFTWGLATLIQLHTADNDPAKSSKNDTATRLVFIADLSPSMYLQDAGPDGALTRHDRMRDVADGILQRISGNLRFGVIGFYTESIPVVMEARDPELVRNVFNGLPLSYAMPVGKTDLGKAVNEALEHVAAFPKGSTRLVIFTDGDSVSLVPIQPRPESVKEVLVLGLGNPTKGTYIDSHQSRQEGDTLQRLATALGGIYEDVNTKHLATTALGDLVVPLAPLQKGLSLSQLAIFAMVLGAAINALIPLALEYLGSTWRQLTPARAPTLTERKQPA
ncbi:VWA domain-containing protein [Prosthecobacter sp.]|uniref:vWA domain-containing protein n=1 Tax=Prosthecobacter sp. TaxID=1965333 RepID=UPI003783F885